VIVTIVETLQVHFIEVKPGTNIFEHLRRSIAVRNEGGEQACALGFFENSHRPFTGDQRLVVRADENFGALTQSIAHQSLGGGFQR
jgi:hypothetical protein